MRHYALRLSTLLALALALSSGAAYAQSYNFQVTNATLSGGDPDFPITDDVTFTNLSLIATYSDNFTTAVPLLDANGATQTSLDTTTSTLQSALQSADPTHGTITSALLTGQFNITAVTLQSSFGGALTGVTINPNFSAMLSVPAIGGVSTPINAIDSNSAAPYGAGTFGATSLAAPESGTLALLACGVLSTGAVILRRRTRTA